MTFNGNICSEFAVNLNLMSDSEREIVRSAMDTAISEMLGSGDLVVVRDRRPGSDFDNIWRGENPEIERHPHTRGGVKVIVAPVSGCELVTAQPGTSKTVKWFVPRENAYRCQCGEKVDSFNPPVDSHLGEHRHIQTGELCCSSQCANDLPPNVVMVPTNHGQTQFVDTDYIEPGSLLSYASTQERMSDRDDEHPYLIGFEVEKEDERLVETVLEESIDRGWLAVSDGSLEDGGFEMVSPAYNLTRIGGEHGVATMKRDFGILSDYLNADCSQNCGGHITVSRQYFSGREMLLHASEMVPLLFSIYERRLSGEYSYADTKDRSIDLRDKFRAVNVKQTAVEFRIFPAVESESQLLWRVDLLRRCLMAIDSGETIAERMLDSDSILGEHLMSVRSIARRISNGNLKETYDANYDYWNEGVRTLDYHR